MGEARSYRLLRTVVLVGMMGSGKTAIGRSLATRLQVRFADSDAELEKAAAATISEIFERDGEPFFRERETEVLQRLMSGPPAIVSTGGGAFLAARNRQIIADQGVAVWLDASVATLWERVRHKDTRPLLRTKNPRATLREIFHQRTPIYQEAGVHVPISGGASIDETTQSVIDALVQYPDILEQS